MAIARHRTALPTTSGADPFGRVLVLGSRRHVAGIAVALVVALAAHGAAAARLALIHTELLAWTRALRFAINEKLAQTYDIEVEKPKPEPEPPPPEPPKEEKAPPPAAPREKLAAPPPPPAAAKAGAVLTQEPDDKPVDFTNSIVTGNADTYAGGVTQSNGTSNTAVYDRHAQVAGVPASTGTKPAAPAPVVDRSRPLRVSDTAWHCDFPPEADSEQIDQMAVATQVTVSPSGRVLSAHAVKDPGYGFGRAAVQCVFRQGSGAFSVAYDRDGNPIESTTTINVHFER
jgi:protein TonB